MKKVDQEFTINRTQTVHAAAYVVLNESDPERKCRLTREFLIAWERGLITIGMDDTPVETLLSPGRPKKPELISPQKLPRRSPSTQEGRIILMHAIAHIEFNAINLAWDAVYRFRDMPKDYYKDWICVAADEASHFKLILSYLSGYDCCYGDYPAHDGLWDMALRTNHDVLIRMALVPRVLEARGLDVTPKMIEKLEGAGDAEAARILTIIYKEEIGHVKLGSHWFKYCCDQRGLDMHVTFRTLVKEYLQGELRGPYNKAARLAAGFDEDELHILLGI